MATQDTLFSNTPRLLFFFLFNALTFPIWSGNDDKPRECLETVFGWTYTHIYMYIQRKQVFIGIGKCFSYNYALSENKTKPHGPTVNEIVIIIVLDLSD